MMYFLVIAGLAIGVALYIMKQPEDFQITRSASMSASPAVVFSQVNDFHKWEAWSPWAKLDPACQNTFEGPTSGQGAIFRWSGNSKVGEGAMTITQSRAGEVVVIRLEFLRPFKAVNTTEFTFRPEGHQTGVTWVMTGKNSFIGKAINLIMNCNKMVGGQFEKGLASMKEIVESTKN